MKIFIEGDIRPTVLKDSDFVHQGGEGSVYVSGDVAYKIYHDPSKMIEVGRIKELRTIQNRSVITPELIIYDDSRKAVGYTMKAVHDTWALTRLFSKSFRKRQGLSNNSIAALLSKMQSTYEELHSKGFIVADGNEQNFLVSSDFNEIYFIDTDSFKTPSFPARAYNESTLDPKIDIKKPSFNKYSDWYAYAIVAFQLITGVHPFKGTALNISKEQNSIPFRIRKKLSIFNSQVKNPRMIVDTDQIDIEFRNWLSSMFETDARRSPPDIKSIGDFRDSSAIASGLLKVDSYITAKEKILDILNLGSSMAIRTIRGVYVGESEFNLTNSTTKVFYDKDSKEPLLASIHNDGLVAKPLMGTAISNIIQCNARSLFFSGKLLYAITDQEVLEISTRLKNSSLRIFGEALDRINLKSTKVFDGVLLESLMGGQFINLLTGEERVYAKFNASAHKDEGILNAKYRNGILYLVTNKSGEYLHKLYKVSKSFKEISISDSWISSDLEINMDVLDNGVYIAMKGESTLLVGHKSLSQTGVKELSLANGQQELDLKSIGHKFVGIVNNEVYKLSMG